MSEQGSEPLQVSFDPWSDSFGFCGALTYSAKLMNGEALPDFMTLSNAQRQFEIRQTSTMLPD